MRKESEMSKKNNVAKLKINIDDDILDCFTINISTKDFNFWFDRYMNINCIPKKEREWAYRPEFMLKEDKRKFKEEESLQCYVKNYDEPSEDAKAYEGNKIAKWHLLNKKGHFPNGLEFPSCWDCLYYTEKANDESGEELSFKTIFKDDFDILKYTFPNDAEVVVNDDVLGYGLWEIAEDTVDAIFKKSKEFNKRIANDAEYRENINKQFRERISKYKKCLQQ